MKILHIWDYGGDSYLLAKYQKKLGHQVDVVKRKGFDPYKIGEFYGYKELRTLTSREFYARMLLKSRNYDIVHVHGLVKLVPKLRKFYPKKKIVLHYHGYDVRSTPINERPKIEKMANYVLISTPDLKEFSPQATYIPNPIDIEHFKHEKPKTSKAFTLVQRNNPYEVIDSFLKQNKIKLEFDVIKTRDKPILYKDMPNFLSQYGLFIDIKCHADCTEVVRAMSNLGKQALAQGLTVLNYELKYLKGFPQEHKPENVVKELMKIYDNL